MKKKKKNRTILLTEKFIQGLSSLQERVTEQIIFLEKTKKEKGELPIDGHIASWEAFQNRLRLALEEQPEIMNSLNKVKVPKIKVGEYFSTNRSKIVYKVKELLDGDVIVHGTNKLQYMGAIPNIKTHISNIVLSDKKAYKAQHENESTDFGGKIVKPKKKKDAKKYKKKNKKSNKRKS